MTTSTDAPVTARELGRAIGAVWAADLATFAELDQVRHALADRHRLAEGFLDGLTSVLDEVDAEPVRLALTA